ncbi:uncharacterized protein DMAD_02489 [Drosophila madeirensis]|uniref:Uncharacterized protein n=1 Tax=Drosophila madeirensis TaxID=30013 RepID=A0AAU9G4Y7_DROMD
MADGGACGAFLDIGSKPINKNASIKRVRSGWSLRMAITMPSTSSLSSANSSKERKVSLEPAGGRSLGKATYRMLFTGFKIDIQFVYWSSVTCSLMEICTGWSCCKIWRSTSWQSSSEHNEWISLCDSESEHSDEEEGDEDRELASYKLPPAESTEDLRL